MPKLKPNRDIKPVVLLRDVRKAEQQVAGGKVLTHAAVAKKLRARLAYSHAPARAASVGLG